MDFIHVLEGERYGRAAIQSLTERHWSNLLAWILDPSMHSEPSLASFAEALFHLAGISASSGNIEAIDRERPVTSGRKSRIMDVDVRFASGAKLWIENKVDRGYEDAHQLAEERDALGPEDHLILLCPRGWTLLRQQTQEVLRSDSRLHHVRWLDLAQAWAELLPGLATGSLERQIVQAMAEYWPRREQDDFLWQVETILEEQGWVSFYPDDFKTAFCLRFPHVYQAWVAERGERGLGGAHSILTLKLVGLVMKRAGQFRLAKTGNSRAPNVPDWGFPTIFEYQVLVD